jgi:hypothetical protein
MSDNKSKTMPPHLHEWSKRQLEKHKKSKIKEKWELVDPTPRDVEAMDFCMKNFEQIRVNLNPNSKVHGQEDSVETLHLIIGGIVSHLANIPPAWITKDCWDQNHIQIAKTLSKSPAVKMRGMGESNIRQIIGDAVNKYKKGIKPQ